MKKKDALDKLFVNCNKIKEGTARRILVNDKDLSLMKWEWNIPLDLSKIAVADINRFNTFLGIGRWNNNNKEKRTKFVLIAKKGELIYLKPEIIRILYNSIKDDGGKLE